MARRSLGLEGRRNLAAMNDSRKVWNSQSRELKAQHNNRNLNQASRDQAYQQRRLEVMSRRYAGREGRLAMAQGNAFLSSSEKNVMKAIEGIKRASGQSISTAAGFSGQGYQDAAAAKSFIGSKFGRNQIMGGGATKDGVGQIGYDVARERGAMSLGIVSSKALEYGTDGIYTHRRHQNFIVKDDAWGGKQKDGNLSPTSRVLVGASDRYIAAGGGGVMADEARAMMSTRGRSSVDVKVFEGNHDTAQRKYEKAKAKWDGTGDAPKLDTSYGVGNSNAIYQERYGNTY